MRLIFLERDPMFVGGSERMSLALCRHAIARGHQACLVHASPGDMVAAYASAGAECLHVPVRPIAVRRPLEALRSFVSLTRIVTSRRVDVIFTSLVSYVSLLASVSRWTGARTAVHLGLVYDFPSPVFRQGMRRVNLGIAPSQHTADGWKARDWPERSLRVIPNGVDTGTFTPGDGMAAARSRLALRRGAELIAYVGRLVPEKGVFTLLRAFARCRRDRHDARLIFVGPASASVIDELRAVGRAEGLPDETWVIRPATATPEDVYRAADLVVCPSEWDEPFGLVPLESMACGTLTIVSDRGVLPQFVAPLEARAQFPAGDADALGRCLSYWLADAGRRSDGARTLAAHARERFGFEACGDAYLRAFQSVLV